MKSFINHKLICNKLQVFKNMYQKGKKDLDLMQYRNKVEPNDHLGQSTTFSLCPIMYCQLT